MRQLREAIDAGTLKDFAASFRRQRKVMA